MNERYLFWRANYDEKNNVEEKAQELKRKREL